MLLVLPAVRPAGPAWSSGLGRLLDSCACAGEAVGADAGLDAALASSPVLSKLGLWLNLKLSQNHYS